MKGFDQINLDSSRSKAKVDQVNLDREKPMTNQRKKQFKFPKKTSSIIAGVLIVLIILVVFGIVLPAKKVYTSAKATYEQGKIFAAAVKKQNIQDASDQLALTQKDLAQTQQQLQSLSYLHFVPIASWYYNDAAHLLKAGDSGLKAAGLMIDSLLPYADVLGLQGKKGSFVMESAQDRIATAVQTMGKITPNIDKIANQLNTVKAEVDAIDTSHYPSFIFGTKVSNEISAFRSLADQGITFVNEARPLIKVLPSLLGEDDTKRYLILFQNDKELRPTGGFITAYAIFDINKGVLKVDRSDDIYNLDNSIANKPSAPAPILKYLPLVYQFNLRDSNLSPDFIVSMQTFSSMYNKAGEAVPVDGIVAIDTSVLVSTIKILDDSVTAAGINFTTQNDPRCDCPQVIFELENNIARPVNYITTTRKGLLGDLMYAIMQKAFSSSPKLYWGPLFQSFITQTSQKHVLFDIFNTDAQSGIEALNAAGQIHDFKGDYLHINDANFAGAKSNLFTTQSVENSYQVENDGSIIKTVTITYKNNHAPSDCNLERGDLCLNAELRDWIRVYVPKGSQLVSSRGSEVKVTTNEDLGKTYFEGFLIIRPMGGAKYILSYKLPFKLSSGSPLPVLVQKQPGTYDNQYTNIFNGKTVSTFPLLTDQEFEIKP